MDDVAIRAEKLSKLYRIGEIVGYGTLRDSLTNALSAPFRRHRSIHRQSDFIWALKDVSFEVKRGEVLGVIGPNGAGKSTLLKILSRITEPTEGYAEIHGRVGSLLEVGSGFHPELTGRENIYLNGAVIGMKKAEVERKFDKIVEFSGVEKFINTPLKRYSSGMQVRLAFSVAAYLEPEILLVDEVLAVGDAAFQKKCLGKMEGVSQQGRTVLFVSHNMAAIRSLCQRTLLIDGGQVSFDGETREATARYINRGLTAVEAVASKEHILKNANEYLPGGNICFKCDKVALLSHDGNPQNEFDSDEESIVTISYKCLQPVPEFRLIVQVETIEGAVLLRTENLDDPANNQFVHLQPGSYKSQCVLPKNFFGQNTFFLSVWLINYGVHHIGLERILKFSTKFRGYNNNLSIISRDIPIRPRLKWHTEQMGSDDSPKQAGT